MKNVREMTARYSTPMERSGENEQSTLPEPVCRGEIDRVASSFTFARAEQLRRLLKWLGERTLTSPRIPPSEKEIAECVLSRTDFDPQTDSLVRKEMSRLRDKLSRYYAGEGLRDTVVIVADAGYLLAFKSREPGGLARENPCWLVLPLRARGPEMIETGDEVLEELLVALHEKGSLELVSPATSMGWRKSSGDLRQFANEYKADFVVEGSLRMRDQTMEATLWLVQGSSGLIQRSRRLRSSTIPELAQLAVSWLLELDDQPEGGSTIDSI
jgi:TolB-like protein